MNGQPQQATIQCKFINPIKPGGKFGSVKDSTDHMWYSNDPTILASLQRGQTITVSYTTQKWSKGPVDVIEQVLDGAPRTSGTEAPPLPVTDKDCRIFVCGFLQSLYHGTGTYPGADALMDIIYATRCAYEAAFAKPLRAPQGKPVQPRQNNYETYNS